MNLSNYIVSFPLVIVVIDEAALAYLIKFGCLLLNLSTLKMYSLNSIIKKL